MLDTVIVAALSTSLLCAAPARDLRVILDCRWAKAEHCAPAKKALDGALALERVRVRVADRVDRLEPLESVFRECPPAAEANGEALPTLWVVPAHGGPELHLAFVLPDGTVRSVLLVEEEAFDRFRRMSPSSDGAVVDLIKATTGLLLIDIATGNSAGGGLEPITPGMMEKVWRSSIRSVLQHGFSKQPPLAQRKLVRDGRWEVRLEKVDLTAKGVELTPMGERLWAAVAEAAAGRRLDDVLWKLEVEHVHPRQGEFLLGVDFVSARYGNGTDGFSVGHRGPVPFKDDSEAFAWESSLDGAHLMPRCFPLALEVTVKVSPRAKKK